jgi:predicted transposase YbfD/YdcC
LSRGDETIFWRPRTINRRLAEALKEFFVEGEASGLGRLPVSVHEKHPNLGECAQSHWGIENRLHWVLT